MWSLEPPELDTEETYETCISRVRSPALKARLEAVTGDVVAAADDYEAAATAAQLHTIVSADNVGALVSRDEMAKVYTYRMVKKGAPGRPVYDELLASSPHDRCPLCGQRIVSTLDHHLPKARFPALVVTPINLIPACADCNKLKLDAAPGSAEDVMLHPYFDDIEDDRWLYAEVSENAPAGVRFFVVPHESWDELTGVRVETHFSVLKLSSLYAAQAAQELVSIRFYLSQLYAAGGADAVQAHLLEMADSTAHAHTNAWRTATYEAFAESAWFCDGGFA